MLQRLTHVHPRLTRRRSALTRVGFLALILFVFAAVAGTSIAGGAGGTAVIAELAPFTGAYADEAVVWPAACKAAVNEVNKAGGVAGGHTLSCISVNDAGNPVTGVAAVKKLLATTSNLAGVMGPGSPTSSAVVPILNAAKVSMTTTDENPAFNEHLVEYYWRMLPAGNAEGAAMALDAHDLGYKRAAAIFTTGSEDQAVAPYVISAFKKFGTITSSQSITPGQSNYRTEVAKLLAGNPQVIFTQGDAGTAATLWLAIKELESSPIPIISTEAVTTVPFQKAVNGSVGAAYVQKVVSFVTLHEPPFAQNRTEQAFKKALDTEHLKGESFFIGEPYTQGFYDGAIIMALAMEEAHSVVPKDYNALIPKVVHPVSGSAVKVYGFGQGKAALAQGKVIQYVPCAGPIQFNRFHNIAAPYAVQSYNASNVVVNDRVIPTASIQAALK